ncbi:hypothetical protein [Neobacillus niacini]|uniref:hypothetical protein n=1 Tax=Neobacillus niacini TaxID=86668 RepID=UPI0028643C77|nr:hypothetical protein [Neobacillus niacini]MDR7002422.1 hypothetical protein [Neobacillus niacini]
MRLEYRLDDQDLNYPALWSYQDIPEAEAVARMTCDFFVKDGQTYAVTATAMDPDGMAVLYVKKENYLNEEIERRYSHIGFELRELCPSGTKLIESKELWGHEEVMTILHSDFIYIHKDGRYLEFSLDSREIDEDRKCYVYYGNFTGKNR